MRSEDLRALANAIDSLDEESSVSTATVENVEGGRGTIRVDLSALADHLRDHPAVVSAEPEYPVDSDDPLLIDFDVTVDGDTEDVTRVPALDPHDGEDVQVEAEADGGATATVPATSTPEDEPAPNLDRDQESSYSPNTASLADRIIAVLDEEGEMAGSELQLAVESSSEFWGCLKELREDGRVTSRKDPEDGRRTLYSLVTTGDGTDTEDGDEDDDVPLDDLEPAVERVNNEEAEDENGDAGPALLGARKFDGSVTLHIPDPDAGADDGPAYCWYVDAGDDEHVEPRDVKQTVQVCGPCKNRVDELPEWVRELEGDSDNEDGDDPDSDVDADVDEDQDTQDSNNDDEDEESTEGDDDEHAGGNSTGSALAPEDSSHKYQTGDRLDDEDLDDEDEDDIDEDASPLDELNVDIPADVDEERIREARRGQTHLGDVADELEMPVLGTRVALHKLGLYQGLSEGRSS